MPSADGPIGLSAVLIYPNTRDVAFASLGYLKVFEMLGSKLQVADLSYLPGPGDPVISPKQGLLLGEQTSTEVSQFDIAAFSISYENDYLHVAELLLKAGLPPLAADRDQTHPLVIFGGFTMSLNPLPVADLADVVVVGEFEAVADRLLETIDRCRREGAARDGMLERIAAIKGVYVPSLGEHPVKRVWCDPEAIAESPESQVGSHFQDMFLVEVGRGCGRGCLFCAAGNLYRPVRMREPESILASSGAAARVGLVGTAVGDHPGLLSVIDRLIAEGRGAGISSLRADQISPELAGRLARCGVKSIAIAPEAGTDELRQRIGKRITDYEIKQALSMLSDAGIASIKLYFMIGLPGETDQDIEAIVSLVAGLAEMRGKSRLSVAAGPFVPKPHTAFQWAGFAPREVLRQRIRILRAVSKIRGCSLKVGSVDEAWTEAVLARGDRSISAPLIEAAGTGRPLKTVLKATGVPDPSRELDTAKPLPWDFLDCGAGREGLLGQYLRARGR